MRTVLLMKLPAAAPHLVTGLRLAAAYSVIGIIAGEFILGDRGHRATVGASRTTTSTIRRCTACCCSILAFAIGLNALLGAFERLVASPLAPVMTGRDRAIDYAMLLGGRAGSHGRQMFEWAGPEAIGLAGGDLAPSSEATWLVCGFLESGGGDRRCLRLCLPDCARRRTRPRIRWSAPIGCARTSVSRS